MCEEGQERQGAQEQIAGFAGNILNHDGSAIDGAIIDTGYAQDLMMIPHDRGWRVTVSLVWDRNFDKVVVWCVQQGLERKVIFF